MIEASFEAVVPKAINAEFEAVIPREKAFDIVNKDIHIDTNGRYEVKADAGTAMTQVNVEVDIQPKEFKDVNFYDYEGTILHSYTWDEFVEKNEMPPLPTHREKEGLVCQEWNYTLEEVLEQGGRCDVGAIYVPSDGNSHIRVETNLDNDIVVLFYSRSTNTTIMWGDGTQDTLENTDTAISGTVSHIYVTRGTYDITIVTDNFNTRRGSDLPSIIPIACVKQVVMGGKTIFNEGFLYGAGNLKGVVLANNQGLYTHLFYGCSITHFNVPRTTLIGSIGSLSFRSSALRSVSFPNTCTLSGTFQMTPQIRGFHIPNNGVYSSYMETRYVNVISVGALNKNLKVVDQNLVDNNDNIVVGINGKIRAGIKSISNNAYYNGSISVITLPESLNTLGNGAFYRCDSVVVGVKIPKNVANIPNDCFSFCTLIPYYDFREHESIPTLASTNAFQNISTTCKIIVPDNLYDQWIAATNWTTYASRIVKASEFVEPTNN